MTTSRSAWGASWPLRASSWGSSAGVPKGEPDAIASLTRSCLLNLALLVSKSKSVVGTSTGLTRSRLLGRLPPRPPRCPAGKPPAPGWRGCLVLSSVRMSPTRLVKLSILASVGAAAETGSLAIAAATAAAAVCVALCCC